MRRAVGSLWHQDDGAVVPTVALSLTALIAVGGIAFDYARLASLDTELQQAADQAALAAATQLDGQAGAQARATAAAQSLITNSTLFASHIAGGHSTETSIASVTFCSAFNDGEPNTTTACTVAKGDADSKFAWVEVGGRTAKFALTPIVGVLTSGTIGGQAVATLNSAICKEPPVMMCNPAETSTVKTFDPASYIGDGIRLTSVGNGGGSWAPGNFGYVDTNISTVSGQENQLRASLGWNNPPGECQALTGIATKPGANVAVTDSLNTRFDIYDGNTSCLSGGLCAASINSVKDLKRPANADTGNGCKSHPQGWQLDDPSTGTSYYGKGIPSSATVPLDTSVIPSAMGHPRDMCHAVSAGGSCTGGRVGDGTWDWDAYFRTNYVRTTAGVGGTAVGTRWTRANWVANTGLDPTVAHTASNFPTRYRVYNWEITNRGKVVDGVNVLGPVPAGASGSTLVGYGAPQCSAPKGYGSGQVPNTTTPDRRRISMAVVNCQAAGVSGSSTDVPVIKWVDLFLVEPSLNRARTNNGDIYVEVIGETLVGGGTAPAGSVIRHDVPVLIR